MDSPGESREDKESTGRAGGFNRVKRDFPYSPSVFLTPLQWGSSLGDGTGQVTLVSVGPWDAPRSSKPVQHRRAVSPVVGAKAPLVRWDGRPLARIGTHGAMMIRTLPLRLLLAGSRSRRRSARQPLACR